MSQVNTIYFDCTYLTQIFQLRKLLVLCPVFYLLQATYHLIQEGHIALHFRKFLVVGIHLHRHLFRIGNFGQIKVLVDHNDLVGLYYYGCSYYQSTRTNYS